MSLTNIELQDLPIEFKEINPTDFDSQLYQISEKQIISPNEDGYISEKLVDLVRENYDEKNTVVINAGVGQGKSTAVIEMVKNYANDDNYIVIVAVPYNSLIKQYVDDFTSNNEVDKSKVFNLSEIETYNFPDYTKTIERNIFQDVDEKNIVNPVKISHYKIHIMTINGLLGNSGSESLFQAEKKIKYFGKLHTYCLKNNKKLIVFFDEIHDSIHNFKEEYLFKLWKFQGVIHKTFIVSATFNEASKEVIKYISEFTDRKIQIIESERKINSVKQSRLHLIFQDSKAVGNNYNLNELFKNLARKEKSFDIIVYSKKQINNLTDTNDSPLNLAVSKSKKLINFCYSDVFAGKNANNKYNANNINIGTNFTTGVNITAENHSLIVILPKRLDLEYINNKGVFSSGINAVIQTLARQRKSGDIYLVMSAPYGIEENSLPYSEQVNKSIYEAFFYYKDNSDKEIKYSNINSQAELLNVTYKKLKKEVKIANKKIVNTSRKKMNRLKFPTKEIFILEKGEQFLTSNFFGGDLSSYVFWAAITNQFQNCKLTSIIKKSEIRFEKNTMYNDIVKQYLITLNTSPFHIENESYLDYFSVYQLYFELENFFIGEDKEVYIDDKKASKKELETIKLYLLNIIVTSDLQTIKDDDYKEIKTNLFIYYIQSCLKHSEVAILNGDLNKILTYELGKNKGKDVMLYIEWLPFIKLLINQIKIVKGRTGNEDRSIIETKPNNDFKELFKEMKMGDNLMELLKIDYFLNTAIFPFNDTLSRLKNEEKIINFFYGLLLDISFQTEKIQINRKWVYQVNQIYELKNLNIENLLFGYIPIFSVT